MFLKIGYARLSTGLQNLDLQEDSLNKFGCEKIFTDHISGAKSNRPGLQTAIDFVRPGDTLVIWRLDRLERNMEDLISIVNRLNERRVGFHSLQENITMDKSSSTGQLMFHLFAAFAEFERNLILERSADKFSSFIFLDITSSSPSSKKVTLPSINNKRTHSEESLKFLSAKKDSI